MTTPTRREIKVFPTSCRMRLMVLTCMWNTNSKRVSFVRDMMSLKVSHDYIESICQDGIEKNNILGSLFKHLDPINSQGSLWREGSDRGFPGVSSIVAFF
jgi:hypothetical protein